MKHTKTVFCFLKIWIAICIAITIFTVCSRKKETDNSLQRDAVIMDRLENAETYFEMNPLFEKAFAFLGRSDIGELPAGRHEIDGDRLFCIISQGPGKSRAEAKLEAHRRYIDIHFIIDGVDEMGWKPTAACTIQDVSYSVKDDIEFFKDEPRTWIQVPAGSFAIFFPEDGHAPMISDRDIHKVVLKVAME